MNSMVEGLLWFQIGIYSFEEIIGYQIYAKKKKQVKQNFFGGGGWGFQKIQNFSLSIGKFGRWGRKCINKFEKM